MSSPLIVPVAELLRRPGSRRSVRLEVDADALMLDGQAPTAAGAASLAEGAAVDVDVVVESLADGLTVNGEVRSEWRGTCGRCLGAAGGPVVAEVQELYQVRPTSEDAFPFDGEQLELEPMVRELVLMELPLMPLCRADCAGLCSICGVDRNEQQCSSAVDERDPRWAALDTLRSSPDVDG